MKWLLMISLLLAQGYDQTANEHVLASGVMSEITHLNDSVFSIGEFRIVVNPQSETHNLLLNTYTKHADPVEIVIRRK